MEIQEKRFQRFYELLLYEDDESVDIEEKMKEFWINGELVLVD